MAERRCTTWQERMEQHLADALKEPDYDFAAGFISLPAAEAGRVLAEAVEKLDHHRAVAVNESNRLYALQETIDVELAKPELDREQLRAIVADSRVEPTELPATSDQEEGGAPQIREALELAVLGGLRDTEIPDDLTSDDYIERGLLFVGQMAGTEEWYSHVTETGVAFIPESVEEPEKLDRYPTCLSRNPWFSKCMDPGQAEAETGRTPPTSAARGGCGNPWHEQGIAAGDPVEEGGPR